MVCGCCDSVSKTHPEDNKQPDLRVTSKGRSCTDTICIILFICAWIVFIVFLIIGVSQGEKNRLWYANNHEGELCGGSKYPNQKYIYYPHISEDIAAHIQRTTGTSFSGDFSVADFLEVDLYGICVKSCPKKGAKIFANKNGVDDQSLSFDCPLNTTSIFYRCMYETTITEDPDSTTCDFPTNVPGNDVECLAKSVKSSKTVTSLNNVGPAVEQLLYWKTRLSGWLADCVTVYPWIIVFGILLPLLFSFLYVLFLKYTIKCFIYLILILSIVVSILFTVFCFYEAEYFTSQDLDKIFKPYFDIVVSDYLPDVLVTSGNNTTYWEWGAWIMVGFDIIIFAIICFSWSDVKVIIATIEISGDVLFTNPLLLLIPVLFIMQMILISAFFIYSSGMLFTLENQEKLSEFQLSFGSKIVTVPETIKSQQEDYGFYMMWINLFGFFWTTQTLDAIYIMIVGGTVGQYYFKPRNKSDYNSSKEDPQIDAEQRGNAVCNAFCRTYRYHLGTCIFGSLIIAIVKIIRAILIYVQKQLQGSGSSVAKCLVCCLSCCFWCLDKCLSFISKNAYIVTSLRGYGFIKSCRNVISTVGSNLKLFALKATTISTIQFLGKFLISTIGAYCSYWYFSGDKKFQYGGDEELSNAFMPVLVVFLIAYVTAAIFMSLFGLVADSLVICLLDDECYFYKHDMESPFTPPNLVSTLKDRS